MSLMISFTTRHSTYVLKPRRFPVISGFRVSWDSRREPGQRVLGVWFLTEVTGSYHRDETTSGDLTPQLVNQEPINREKDGKTYKIVTREYMAEGHDGFLPLKGHKYLIDDEGGQMMSTIVRKYLLGESHAMLRNFIT